MSQTTFEKLGPYHVDRILGRGGMGTVFAAMDERTSQSAAVKVLAPGLAGDETFRERFAAEIESLKKLHHPHIVQLYGFGEQDGHLFYAMELVDGSNLDQELRAGRRFTWRDVTRLGIEICRALKHAHDHGVIHRDLKPANLLLDENEQIKLSDFGIAKLFGFTQMTVGGNVMGTADYMAPEQAEGKATTPRCDLYSLGCVMYALLAGRPPFSGNTIAEVVHKLRYEQAQPIQQLATDVPDELAQIIQELLEKDPERRMRTALALSHRLKAMEHALSVKPREEDGPSDNSVTEISFLLRDSTEADNEPPLDIAHRTTVSLPEDQVVTSDPAGQTGVVESGPDAEPEVRTHFTPVDTSSPWREETRGESTASLIAYKIFGVAVAATFVVWLWFNLQPPTSDTLYQQIEEIVVDQEGSPADADGKDRVRRLLSAERYVQRFLTDFPDDPRRKRIDEIAEEIELYRLERAFATRARRPASGAALLPVEQTYLAAIRQSLQDPERAIELLQGLIDLYEYPPDAAEPDPRELRQTQACVELSKKQMERLQKVVADTSREHCRVLVIRLATADRLLESHPMDAMAIWRGIISLYHDKPWATEYVRQAREKLEKQRQETATDERPSGSD